LSGCRGGTCRRDSERSRIYRVYLAEEARKLQRYGSGN
jgi:hypothetical protein